MTVPKRRENDPAAPPDRLLEPAAQAFLARWRLPLVGSLWVALRALQMAFLQPNQDVNRYFESAGAWLAGADPYVTQGLEYPPGALPFFALARLVSHDLASYSRAFALEMLAVDGAILWLLGRCALRVGALLRRPAQAARADAAVVALVYLGLTALLRTLPFERYDLVLALALVGWLGSVCGGGRRITGELFLALGIWTKLMPLIMLPVYAAWCYAEAVAAQGDGRGSRGVGVRAALLGGVRPLALTLLATLPFAARSGTHVLDFLAYHRDRGIQIESLWSSLLLLAHTFAGAPLGTQFRFGCMELAHALAPTLAQTASFASAAAVLTIAGTFAWRLLRPAAGTDRAARAALLLHGSVALLAACMALNKVFSPQYMLWLAPLLPLLLLLPRPGSASRQMVLGGAVAFLLTTLVLHFYYIDLLRMEPLPVLLVATRNMLVFGLAVMALAPPGRGLLDAWPARIAAHRGWASAAIVVAVVWAFLGNLSETTANDIWIQLRSGDDILRSGAFPSVEVYSASVLNRPFIAHEWLSSVIFSLLVAAFGGAGLSFLAAATAAITFALLYYTAPPEQRRTAWYVCLLMACVYLVSFRILVRPHIFTIIAQGTLLLLLERWRRSGDWRLLAGLVPVQLLWVNLHGAAPFGPALMALLAGVVGTMALVPALQRGSEVRTLAWRDARQLALTAVAMAAACVVNPYGLKLFSFSLDLFTNDYAKTRIWEWTTPFMASNLHYYWFWLYASVLVTLWLSLATRLRTLPVIDAVLAAVVTFLSVRANRFVPDLALFAFPIVARSLHHVAVHALRPALWVRRPWLELGLGTLLLTQAVTYGFAHSAREHRPAIGWGFGGDMPYQEVDILRKLHARGIIFNEYSDGALLIHDLYPQLRVVLDSRIDLYPWDVVDEYDRAYMSLELFRRYIAKRRIGYVLLYSGRAHPDILTYLATDASWQQLSATNGRVLYRRRSLSGAGTAYPRQQVEASAAY